MPINENELLRLLPRVLRARDFHLYSENGKRLTDLWLQGGRAILGHKGPRFVAELKNAAERGLFSPFPHTTERRIIKALAEIFPGRAFRLFLNESSLRRSLAEAGIAAPEESVPVWRPFLTETAPGAIFTPILPWPLGSEALVLEKDMEASFPFGDIIPPVILAPAARALYDLVKAMKAPGHGRQQYRKIEKALGAQKTQAGLWRRQGIYLIVEQGIDKENYKEMFLSFLEGGFLLPPTPEQPAILPAFMSDGEESKLARLIA